MVGSIISRHLLLRFPSGSQASFSSAHGLGSVPSINTFTLSTVWPHVLVSAAHAAVRRNGHKCSCPSPLTQTIHPVPHLSPQHLEKAWCSMLEGRWMDYVCQSLISIKKNSNLVFIYKHTITYQPTPLLHKNTTILKYNPIDGFLITEIFRSSYLIYCGLLFIDWFNELYIMRFAYQL